MDRYKPWTSLFWVKFATIELPVNKLYIQIHVFFNSFSLPWPVPEFEPWTLGLRANWSTTVLPGTIYSVRNISSSIFSLSHCQYEDLSLVPKHYKSSVHQCAIQHSQERKKSYFLALVLYPSASAGFKSSILELWVKYSTTLLPIKAITEWNLITNILATHH